MIYTMLRRLRGDATLSTVAAVIQFTGHNTPTTLSCCRPLLPTPQVIAATNRADILDPALMRSGRLDRKIEFPHPNEDARAKILRIHSRKMNVAPDVNFEELARSSDDFNAAQLKAVRIGMIIAAFGGVDAWLV